MISLSHHVCIPVRMNQTTTENIPTDTWLGTPAHHYHFPWGQEHPVLESNLECDEVEEDKRRGAWSWGSRATSQRELWWDPVSARQKIGTHAKGGWRQWRSMRGRPSEGSFKHVKRGKDLNPLCLLLLLPEAAPNKSSLMPTTLMCSPLALPCPSGIPLPRI